LKKLPHNTEAEASFLGCLILDPMLLGEVLHRIDESAFSLPAHARVFVKLRTLFDQGREIDSVILAEELQRDGDFPTEDSSEFLGSLMDTVVSSAHWENYLNIVREKYLVRNLIHVNNNILEECYGDYQDADDLVDRAEQKIFDLAKTRQTKESQHIGDVLKETLMRIERSQGQGLLTGVATGFTDLDDLTCGLQKSELIIVAARPSMGKTTLALNLSEHVAVKEKTPVLIFSLEMAASQLTQNMLCSHARVNSHKLRRNYLSNEEMARLSLAAGTLHDAPLFIDDTAGMTIRELRAKARRMKSRNDIGLIIVDYLQLLDGSSQSSREGRVQVISEISRSLKGLARELQIPVVALAQLSRAVEQREGNKPRMSDLRESGSIEQDADVIVLLYREDYYNKQTENQGIVDLIIAKQRNGPTGDLKLHFARDVMRFENLSLRQEPDDLPAL
jgi:replicative DNA helicase